MEIKLIRRSGVPRSEVDAHQAIQKAFSASPFSRAWRGYASFKLVRRGPGSGDEDFDLVLVTHSAICVIELKNWRGTNLKQVGNNWFVDGEDCGESPVRLAAEKARRLGSRMSERLGRANTAFVRSYVVMSGIAEIELSEDDGQSVLFLEDLLSWANSADYASWINRHAHFNLLTKLAIYDGFFGSREVKPRDYLVEGFQPGERPIWTHPNQLYAEFEAKAKDDKDQLALLRRWNFDALGTQQIGEQDRAFLGLREQRVYEYVEERSSDLQSALLRPISRKEAKHVTMDFVELFSLPSRFVRLTEFANSVLPKLDPDERLRLVKALLSRFADLHDLRVAHRDIGEHNLWVERPAQIVVSGFPAAYFPALGTVGAFREQVKVERSKLPEDVGVSKEHTPYSRDVFLLGATCIQILFGERPPKVAEVYGWAPPPAKDPYAGALNGVLSTAMSADPRDRYATAREMLNAFNQVTSQERTEVVDLARFSAFKASTKASDYAESAIQTDDDDLQFFRSTSESADLAVKVWFGVEPDTSKQDFSIRLLGFLERARTLRGCAVVGMPRILDFGLTRRSLMLVREWIAGVTLSEWMTTNPSLERRVELSRALTATLVRLHALELAHGDMHPGNVLVDADGKPTLIDALDFVRSADTLCTTAYLPADYKSLGPFERDRYGLAAMLVEVFDASQVSPAGPLPVPRIYEQLKLLLEDRQACTLEPLQKALERAFDEPVAPAELFNLRLPLTAANLSDGPLHLDNGVLHIRVTQSRRRNSALVFRLTGVGRQITIEWDTEKEQSVYVAAGAVTQSMLFRLQLEADADVAVRVTLVDGPTGDVSALMDFLLADGHVAARVGRLKAIQRAKKAAGNTTPAPAEAKADQVEGPPVEEGELVQREEDAIELEADHKLPAPLTEVWRALMDAEEDALPTLTVSAPHRPNPSDRSQTLVPCHMESEDILFDPREAVYVEKLGRDRIWHRSGRLNQRETSFGQFTELAIEDLDLRSSFRIGDKIRLRGQLEKSSFSRRTLAVQRILSGRAVIPDLIDYFDPTKGASFLPTKYAAPSDADLDEYSEGGKKLNESQKTAFRQVLSNGPVSLVQGPPGTGKTWFIAALLHFLMTKEQARRILLVSQSNEAVNNALEKALELCRSKKLEFNAVRLGREEFASEAIRHLHESSIEQGYREEFKAEREDRIVELARIMGLPTDFARAFVSLQRQLGRLVGRIDKMSDDIEVAANDGERRSLEARRQGLIETFEIICREAYEVEGLGDPATKLASMEAELIRSHGIFSEDAVERLRKLVRLSDDWQSALGSPHANFAEFLAKSRTVVAGTLVGIGHFASGVVENLYDWVIIDEAGRAAPSELAVAMQTGQRILLVGDHLQLPPTFSREVQDTVQRRFSVGEDSKVFASDFERIYESAYGQAVGASLLMQYRMAPNIGKLVSDCFYDKKLKTGRGASPEYYSLLPSFMSHEVTWVDTGDAPNARERHSENRDEWWNDGEARVVMAILQHIVEAEGFLDRIRSELQPGEPAIGIICMYSKQRDILDDLKSKASWLGSARRLVKIDTVDSYQGKENRIVILSTVRTDRPGFLKKFNRINVGLSRAMERLFIVGAAKLWSGRNNSLPLGKVLTKVREMECEDQARMLPANEVLQ